MRLQPLDKRLDVVERKVESLETLPGRVASLTLEFSALRSEFSQLRLEMRGGFSAVHGLIDETRAQMRMLHEDVVARLALLDQHLGRKSPARRLAPKTDPTKNG